ncbi:hypothetical protein NJ7G_4267 [Natrinema sp. J7-2]|nr:hypothetical protein NJ7G_4267 [Natrinema sp. J7-2]
MTGPGGTRTERETEWADSRERLCSVVGMERRYPAGSNDPG